MSAFGVFMNEYHNLFIGSEVFDIFSRYFLQARDYSDCVILTDSVVAEKCLPVLYHHCSSLQHAQVMIVPSGEQNKTLQTCESIWEQWLSFEYDRNLLVVVVGGGMLCDLGGFCASAYKRGVEYVLFPTTLMAQCDAAIGGKNGINLQHFKNQIGYFSYPLGIFIYPGFLRTLGKREMLNGFAEMIKHAIIQDPDYWRLIVQVPLHDEKNLEQAIVHSVKIKQRIVENDFYEKGLRKALNFGHTFGHAIESFFLEKHIPVLHGEAVAAGIIMESYLSHVLCGLGIDELTEISSFIRSLYPVIPLEEETLSLLVEIMKNDKKNTHGQIKFALIEGIGYPHIDVAITDPEPLIEAFSFYREVYHALP